MCQHFAEIFSADLLIPTPRRLLLGFLLNGLYPERQGGGEQIVTQLTDERADMAKAGEERPVEIGSPGRSSGLGRRLARELMLQQVALNLEPKADFSVNLWKFDQLGDPVRKAGPCLMLFMRTLCCFR